MCTKRIILPLLLFAHSLFLDAQTVQQENFHSAKRASIYSAIVPGYGQLQQKILENTNRIRQYRDCILYS